jgi:hypothetical protein
MQTGIFTALYMYRVFRMSLYIITIEQVKISSYMPTFDVFVLEVNGPQA